MFGRSLTLLTRALRVDARTSIPAVARGVLVLLSLAMIAVSAELTRYSFGAPGLSYFKVLFYLNLFSTAVFGIGYFSRAIAEEKEQVTLPLLRMATVSPLALLLGKSTSQLLQGLLLLTLQFPFMLLAVTLGGVTVLQVVAAYVTIVAFMIFMANLALFCSVGGSTTGEAAAATFTLLFGCWILPYAGSWALTMLNNHDVLSPSDRLYSAAMLLFDTLARTSPLDSAAKITTTGFTGPVISLPVVSNVLAGLALFLVSWWSFDELTGDEHTTGPTRTVPRKRRGLRCLAPGRVWQNALAWKDFYFLAGGWQTVLVKLPAYGVLIGVLYTVSTTWSGGRTRFDELGEWAMISMLAALLVTSFYLAARLWRAEIEWKTLDSLMLLPKSPIQLSYGKAAGCLVGLLPEFVYFAAGGVLSWQSLLHALSTPVCWFFVIEFAFFVTLVVFMSLYGRSGPAYAALAMLMVHGCCTSVAIPVVASVPVMALTAIYGILLLQNGISERLNGRLSD